MMDITSKFKGSCFFLSGMLLLFAGCHGYAPSFEEQLAALQSAKELSVYEGLPHQDDESLLFKNELTRADTIQIGGYPFYTPKKMATQIQSRQLAALFSDPDTFYISRGYPLECGFHPDYAISYMEGSSERFVLLCFGCNEARFLIDPDGEEFYNRRDLGNKSFLQGALAPFRDKRPRPKMPGR